jgi:hypothetical protein
MEVRVVGGADSIEADNADFLGFKRPRKARSGAFKIDDAVNKRAGKSQKTTGDASSKNEQGVTLQLLNEAIRARVSRGDDSFAAEDGSISHAAGIERSMERNAMRANPEAKTRRRLKNQGRSGIRLARKLKERARCSLSASE